MAKFLDATGLNRLIGKIKAAVEGRKSAYLGTCSTAANTYAKVATVETFPTVAYDDNGTTKYKPANGVVIGVKYSNSNSYKTAGNTHTLNVNQTGAWPLYYNNAELVSTTSANTLVAGYKNRYTYYMFNGSQWVFLSASYDANSTYSAMTQAEITAGTGTTGRTLTPKLLRDNFYTEGECDSKFLQEETDPTVPSWAKASTKPSYSYSEISGTPTLATVATSGSYNDLSNKPTIPDELSDLSDDSTHRLVTDTEKSTWNAKQAALTFDDAPASNSSNPVTSSGIYLALSGKQDTLVSGTSIKTLNSASLLGSGNISLKGVVSILKTGTSGLVDTYTITYTDSTTATFTVTNGAQGNSGYTGAVGELEVVNNLTDGGSAAALSAEMGKTLGELIGAMSLDKTVSASQTLNQKYVDVYGAIQTSGYATTTLSFYEIDGNAVGISVGKSANSASRVVSLAKSLDQTTNLLPASSKKGDESSYTLELTSYPPEYKYLVICHVNTNSNTVELHKPAADILHTKADVSYLSDDYYLEFDESECLIENKYINYSTGAETSASYWSASDYIEIPAGMEWYRYLTNFNSTNSGIAFYNSSKTYISGVKHDKVIVEARIPTNAKYVRFCVDSNQSSSTCALKLYSSGQSGYNTWLNALLNQHGASLDKLGRDITLQYTNADCTITGKFIYSINGTATAYAGFVCSDFLPVIGDKVTVTSSWGTTGSSSFAFYTANKTFISSVVVKQVTDKAYAIPDTAKYIRFTSKPNETNNFTMSLSGIDGLLYYLDHIEESIETPVKERHILMVGNSFTMHACEYLQTICTNLDASNITLQYIYTSGASLADYANNLSTSRNLTTAVNGGTEFGGGTLPIIFSQDWDVIVFQQASIDSFDYTTYKPYLSVLVNSVLSNCPNKDVKIIFNMTWPYSESLTDENKGYIDSSQMWQDILQANKQLREDYGHLVVGTVASGTAIQNIRSALNLKLSYDKRHVSKGVGRYVAGCELYVSLLMPFTGISLYNDTTTTIDTSSLTDTDAIGAVSVTSSNRLLCQKAAMYAYIHPWGETNINNV